MAASDAPVEDGEASTASPAALRPEAAPKTGARIFGTVTDEHGQPLAGVRVKLRQDYADPAYLRKLLEVKDDPAAVSEFLGGRAFEAVHTATDGMYAVEDIKPGAYDLTFAHDGLKPATEKVVVEGTESQQQDMRLEPGAEVRGHVVTSDGLPATGVEVSEGWRDRKVVTDAEGAFHLGGLDSASGRVRLKAHDPSGTLADVSARFALGTEDVRLVMAVAGRITGVVLDAATKTPVAGATLLVRDHSALAIPNLAPKRADEAGQFELSGILPGRHEVQVHGAGYAPETVTVEISEGCVEELEVRLGPGSTCTGRVTKVDGGGPLVRVLVLDVTQFSGMGPLLSGEAMAGIMASLNIGEDVDPSLVAQNLGGVGTAAAYTDAAGEFRLDHLPCGARRIVFAHTEYRPHTEPVTIEDGRETRLDVVLTSGARIVGHVSDANGVAVEGAMVQAMSPAGGTCMSQTGVDGGFTLAGLKPGSYMVVVIVTHDKPGQMTKPEMRAVTVAEAETVTVNFGRRPEEGTVVLGSVTGGGPMARRIALIPRGQGLAGARMGEIGEGGFSFEGVTPGSYILAVQPVFHTPVEVMEGTPEIRVDVVLSDHRICGQVFGANGRPVPGAKVEAMLTADRDDPIFQKLCAKSRCAEDGAFVVEGLSEGEYDVEVSFEGYQTETLTVSVPSPVAGAVQVELAAGGTLTVTVLGPSGAIVQNAVLMAVDEAGRVRGASAPGFVWTSREPSLKGLAPGRYSVYAFSRDHAFGRLAGVEYAGGDLELELGLAPGSTLALTCTDTNGAPLVGAELELRFPDGGILPEPPLEAFFGAARTGADGRLRRERLRPGAYQGTVRASGGRETTFDVTVPETEFVEVSVSLPAD
ncbi:carboxypeptidase regulatory-like domain-containing protein [Planctomycetota bacterium]